jgi:hypothetical protein
MGYGLVNAYAAVQVAKPDIPVYFTNQIVTTNTIVINYGDIIVQNVFVTYTGKLTLDATGKVTINSGFEMGPGARLEIKSN